MASGASSQSVGTPPKGMAAGIRDTLEQIVVAFILAFAFRAFLLEAFVIPTGSMAVTLYGAQINHTCSTCGYEYARGVAEEETAVAARNPGTSAQLRCPNCDTMVDQATGVALREPDSGDRILVLKWSYDLGWFGLGPQRWDVTVFKNPSDGQANYIKRLVGLPGEVLEIIDGDVYTAPIEELKRKEPGLVEAMDGLRHSVALHRYPDLRPAMSGTGPGYERRDLAAEYDRLNERLLPHLGIQRKTELAQQSLWIDVYNHDYCPAGLPSGRPLSNVRWNPVSPAAAEAWNTSQPEIRFSSASDDYLAVRFEGKPLRDFVAYNFSQTTGRSDEQTNLVGDLRLRFGWLPDDGEGSIRLEMNRDLDTFQAEIRRDGLVRLDHVCQDLPGGRQAIGEVRMPHPFAAGQAVAVELVNVDYRASVRIDGQEVIATNDQQYQPDLRRQLKASYEGERVVVPAQVEIAARGLRCRLRHLVLERDVYYRSVYQNERLDRGPVNPYLGWRAWGTAGCPILLRPDRVVDGEHYYGEFFMLGDNSPASKDSRRWWEIGPHLTQLGDEYQLGTVPRDQLIGRAFFVYWPAGYRTAWAGSIGLIPNVGRMRWIR